MDSSIYNEQIQPKEGADISHQQRAYKHVKQQIFMLTLKPGQYITDNEVALELEISRTPVREALRRLEQEGMLIYERRRGWKVYALTLEDIHDIFEIKIQLEGMLARKAAGCKDEEKRTVLKKAMAEMKRVAQNEDFEAWRESDMKLHKAIFGMCANKKACEIIQTLNDQWYRLRAGFTALEGRLDRSILEHEAIVNNILSGDGVQAEYEMRCHLKNVQDELTGVMTFVLNFVHEGV